MCRVQGGQKGVERRKRGQQVLGLGRKPRKSKLYPEGKRESWKGFSFSID